MAIARIITRVPQEVESLAEQLRGRGYEVEVAAPGESSSGTAELEITVDTYEIQDALTRAAQLAQAANSDIFVAPGIWERAAASEQPQGELEPPVEIVYAEAAEPAPMPAVTPAVQRGKAVREALAGFAGAVGHAGEQVGNSVFAASRRLAGVLAARRRAERRPSAPTPVVPIREQSPAPPVAAVRRLPQIANPRTPSREHEWKLAAIFSTAVALAVMLAWLVTTHKASSPIPAGMVMRSNGIQQQVPFGPVTLRPPALASARRVAPRAPKPQTVQQPARTSGAQRPQEDDEVVVRHFTKPNPAASRTMQSSSVKRFSDLE